MVNGKGVFIKGNTYQYITENGDERKSRSTPAMLRRFSKRKIWLGSFLDNVGRNSVPPWCVDNKPHKTPRNNTRDGQREDPATIDPPNHPPVDCLPGTRAETHGDSGTRDALCRRDREGEARGQDDSDGAAKFHTEAAAGRVECESVSEVAHHVVAVFPEADDDAGTAEDEDPDRNRRFI